MNTELIARLAEEAGFKLKPSATTGAPWIDLREPFAGGHVLAGAGYRPPQLIDHMAKFAALVAEECAKAADAERGTTYKPKEYEDNHRDGHTDGCNDCAAAIRALFPPAP